MKIKNIQKAECLKLGVCAMTSIITHHDAGLGIFMNIAVDAGQIISFYYGKIVYKYM